MAVLSVNQICFKRLLQCPPSVVVLSETALSTTLVEVGRFTTPNPANKSYEPGQLFINKALGYRGIVIYPWMVPVYDRDVGLQQDPLKNKDNDITVIDGKEVKFTVDNYYQVFVDFRDRPYVSGPIESVSVARDVHNRLQTIPGLDYVAHEDMLPYVVTEKVPFQHEWFEKFFKIRFSSEPTLTDKEPIIEATGALKVWQSSNFNRLKVLEVHKQTTEGVKVTVIPFFMGSYRRKLYNIFSWRYSVRFHNVYDTTVTLASHVWRVFGQSGPNKVINGIGVMGQELVLDKKNPVFQYTDYINLQSPIGRMSGSFKAYREDGSSFECHVPMFVIEGD